MWRQPPLDTIGQLWPGYAVSLTCLLGALPSILATELSQRQCAQCVTATPNAAAAPLSKLACASSPATKPVTRRPPWLVPRGITRRQTCAAQSLRPGPFASLAPSNVSKYPAQETTLSSPMSHFTWALGRLWAPTANVVTLSNRT